MIQISYYHELLDWIFFELERFRFSGLITARSRVPAIAGMLLCLSR